MLESLPSKSNRDRDITTTLRQLVLCGMRFNQGKHVEPSNATEMQSNTLRMRRLVMVSVLRFRHVYAVAVGATANSTLMSSIVRSS